MHSKGLCLPEWDELFTKTSHIQNSILLKDYELYVFFSYFSFSYVVNMGLIDKLYGCFLSVQGPVDENPKMSAFLQQASALLHSMCKLCFIVTGRWAWRLMLHTLNIPSSVKHMCMCLSVCVMIVTLRLHRIRARGSSVIASRFLPAR